MMNVMMMKMYLVGFTHIICMHVLHCAFTDSVDIMLYCKVKFLLDTTVKDHSHCHSVYLKQLRM